MIEPLYFQTEQLLVHPFRAEDMERFGQLSMEVFSILSDDLTLKYIPEKRLFSLADAELYLQTMLMNYHAGLNYLHFISDRSSGKVIGLIDLISPGVARQHYQMDEYPFFIEFYLGAAASGCYIMTEILPAVVEGIFKRGIHRIAAVINRNNIAARKVLENARFSYKAPFDLLQDLYEIY